MAEKVVSAVKRRQGRQPLYGKRMGSYIFRYPPGLMEEYEHAAERYQVNRSVLMRKVLERVVEEGIEKIIGDELIPVSPNQQSLV